MKILTLITLIITSTCFAQSYSDFHDYWYSDKVVLKSSQSISDFAKEYDYKKDSRFDWIKAVMHMNGVVSSELSER